MKIAEHKTMEVFRRYNAIDEQDLKAAQRQMDTNNQAHRQQVL
jgi:hypothetical protein